MPIIFISLSETYTKDIIKHGYKAFTMKIQDYVPNSTKKTYFVSPANCLCFMDGGFDLALSTIIFPNIEKKVKQIAKNLNITNLLGRNHLPIGSSIIVDEKLNKSLIVSPTMLLPQNVSKTNNAYYCTIAALNNILINRNEDINDIDIIFTSLCCGYGKMDESKSINQILKGINDYKLYKPIIIDDSIIINEPNLLEQPKIDQNTEWFLINNNNIVQV